MLASANTPEGIKKDLRQALQNMGNWFFLVNRLIVETG
jgi:hypothetical protein